MSLINVYLKNPVYPQLVSINSNFVGANTVFEGIKNPAINLDELTIDVDYEIVEGLNVTRTQFFFSRAAYSTSDSFSYPEYFGNFWLYTVTPYPAFDRGLNNFLSRNYYDPTISQLVQNWDVWQYLVSHLQNLSISPLRFWSGRIRQSTPILGYQYLSTNVNYTDTRIGWVPQQMGIGTQIYPSEYNSSIRDFEDGKWFWDWDDYRVCNVHTDYFSSGSANNEATYQVKTIPTVIRLKKSANYIDLLSGFSADNRTIKSQPVIIPTISENITLSYYRENKLEPIPTLRTIDWMSYECNLTANVPITLPIVDCTLGTLHISSSVVRNQLVNSTVPITIYPYKYYFEDSLPELFIYWNQLLNTTIAANERVLHVLGANNDHWNNRQTSTAELNFDITHPMFAVDNQRAYNWHIKPQSDGSYGDLVMDSPRTIEIRLMIEQLLTALNALQYQTEIPAIVGTGTVENPETPAKHKLDWYIKNSQGSGIPAAIITKITEIWKALGGAKYATNQLDNTKDRVTNLGFLTERIAKVLGIRFDDNGKIEVDKEKATVRKVIDKSKDVDPEKVGINGFGDGGMVVKRINNRFKNKGEIVSDQCVVVQDMPDLIQEYFEQANLALGIQESSAIEIKQDGTAARFNSQLEILVELVNLMSSGNEMTRAALVSSLVTQSQTNELIAGLGLPSVTKTIPIKIGKKVSQLPFKGIAAHRSISQEIATCTYNVGIGNGNAL
jgi:hypothetical protein